MILAVVMLASALMVIDMMVVSVALPQIGSDLPGATLTGLQWIMVGYSLAFGALIQPAASLSDRLGSKRMFLAGMAFFTLASFACGLAPTMLALNGFRIVKGAAAAIMFANVMPLLAKTFVGQRRTMAIAMWAAVLGVCSTIAPVLGGVLVNYAGWRWMFFINVPLGIAALVVGFVSMSNDKMAIHHHRFDWLGALLLVVALVGVNLVLTWIQTDRLHPLVVIVGAAALVFLAVFVWRQLRVPVPVLDLGLLRDRTFLGVALLALLNRICIGGSVMYMMLYLQSGHHFTPLATGLLLVPLGIFALIGSIVAGKAQAIVPPRRVLSIGFWLLAASAALIAVQVVALQNPWWLLPAMGLWGFANSLANTPMMNVATNSVPLERVGMATGLVNSFYPIGVSLGTVMMGIIFTGLVDGAKPSLESMGMALGLIYGAVAVLSGAGAVIASTLISRHVGFPPDAEMAS